MRPAEFYRGREQTYVKHFFLERYLEQVAYHILWFRTDFVYVDGFSGPWRSEDEEFSDTSFYIAVDVLRRVRDDIQEKFKKRTSVRCIFVEKNPEAFVDLKRFADSVTDLPIQPIHGEFENAVARLVSSIGRSFSLVFIDPTGWTGFGLRQIQPLLALRGEVLINFMFNDINRFLEEPRRTKAASYDALFGGADWYDEFSQLTSSGWGREDAILEVYTRRVKEFGSYKYATSTRIKAPLQDRTYFHLVYATKNWKGINVYRKVEQKASPEQEMVGATARERAKEESSIQASLFDRLPIEPSSRSFGGEQRFRLRQGREKLEQVIRSKLRVSYKELSAEVQQVPLVWEKHVKDWLVDMAKNSEIRIDGLTKRERRPNPNCTIIYLNELD